MGELFAARTTKASGGGQRVPQTISKEDGRKIEEETGSRERLLRRGRRKTSAHAAAAQNVKWNASAFAKEPKEYEEGISWKRSRRKRSDGGVGGKMKDYFDAVNEDATSSQQFYIVFEEGEGRADTKRAEQILRENKGGFVKDSNGFPVVVGGKNGGYLAFGPPDAAFEVSKIAVWVDAWTPELSLDASFDVIDTVIEVEMEKATTKTKKKTKTSEKKKKKGGKKKKKKKKKKS